jgi:hypothetical protein
MHMPAADTYLNVVHDVVTSHVPDVLLRAKDGASERRSLVGGVVNCTE